jgi:hypothetical protein
VSLSQILTGGFQRKNSIAKSNHRTFRSRRIEFNLVWLTKFYKAFFKFRLVISKTMFQPARFTTVKKKTLNRDILFGFFNLFWVLLARPA